MNNNKSKIISGPVHFEPKFTSFVSQGRDEIMTNEKTKCAFINGFVSNKYIYLLYSGRNKFGPKLDQSNFIYVYDWNGNPISKIKFPQKISAFTISNNDSIIYAFDPSTQFLIRGNLQK